MKGQCHAEVAAGQRFEFGANWLRFLDTVDEGRIALAVQSLRKALGLDDLTGKSFLDIGSGSGLSSLAARRLGAEVYSFDYDPSSVACTAELKKRFFPDDPQWTVAEGSVLDINFLRSLGHFDIVYSWGVLHHTGTMWRALEHASLAVAPDGYLYISIYNDQGPWSRRWLRIKKVYNRLPPAMRLPYAIIVMGLRELRYFPFLKPASYVRTWKDYASQSLRGMSKWHDLIDWVGGYPFEVAKPEQVFEYLRNRGFLLSTLKTCAGGLGCNEYVLIRQDQPTNHRKVPYNSAALPSKRRSDT